VPTRQAIRQTLIDLDVVDGASYGTATAGGAATVTDTTLLAVGGNAVTRYASQYLYRPSAANAADYYRRVTATGYAPTTGVLTHGTPNYTVNPLASSDTGYYELWPYDPKRVNRAFSRALTTQCFLMQQDNVTTNGNTRYQVSASPFSLTNLTSANQFFGVAQVQGTDPTATLTPWMNEGRTVMPEWDNDTFYLRFDPAPTGTIRIAWKKFFTDVTNETSDAVVDSTYAAWATLKELFYALRETAIERGENADHYQQRFEKADQRTWIEGWKQNERFNARLFLPRPRYQSFTGAPGSGRGGGGGLGGHGSR
jgi:hypothetical protein